MSAISVNDNIMLGLALWHFLFIGFHVTKWTLWSCKVVGYLALFAAQQGTYQVIFSLASPTVQVNS